MACPGRGRSVWRFLSKGSLWRKVQSLKSPEGNLPFGMRVSVHIYSEIGFFDTNFTEFVIFNFEELKRAKRKTN